MCPGTVDPVTKLARVLPTMQLAVGPIDRPVKDELKVESTDSPVEEVSEPLVSPNIEGTLEGDRTIVNVIADHPSLPLIAASGIDTTVKVRQETIMLLNCPH